MPRKRLRLQKILKVVGILTGVIIGIFIFLFVVCLILWPFITADKYKDDLNNPYVDSDYKGWKDVALDQQLLIKIPSGWNVSLDPIPIITDEQGQTLAIGKNRRSAKDNLITDIVEEHYGKEVASFNSDGAGNGINKHFRSSSRAFYWITLFEDGTESREVLLVLPCKNYEYCFCFFTDERDCYVEAEAIAWSAKDLTH